MGSPGLGFPIAVACASLPLTSFSSIQLALYRRRLDFKTVMPVRVVTALVPLVVTVPLALAGIGFWSLIFGTIAGNIVTAFALTALSPWKPQLYYSFPLLQKMFAFSGWSLLEAIAIWATSWAGTFVVGNLLDAYDLGLYRQPMTLVNSAFNLITNATTPVLFSSLSRLQGSMEEFQSFFYRFQFNVAMFVLPLGFGIFCFRDFLTDLLLGSQWRNAALMLGCWGLSTLWWYSGIIAVRFSVQLASLGRPYSASASICALWCQPCTFQHLLDSINWSLQILRLGL